MLGVGVSLRHMRGTTLNLLRWILSDNFWRDENNWVDSETWNDGV